MASLGVQAQPCEPSFRSGTPLDFIAPGYGVIRAFDFNGDGRKDLLFGAPHSTNVALSAGNGSFNPPTEALPFNTLALPSYPSVAVGDMDGDGTLDLVLVEGGTSPGTSLIKVYKGTGRGDFQNVSSTTVPADLGPPVLAVLGDFDGNGTLDLAALGGGGYLWIYPGDGRTDVVVVNGFLYGYVPGWDSIETSLARPGGFVVVTQAATPLASPVLADFDGDGHVDLIVSGMQDRSALLYRNACHSPGAHLSPIPGPAISPRPHGRRP